jgi:hypothetical protein
MNRFLLKSSNSYIESSRSVIAGSNPSGFFAGFDKLIALTLYKVQY